VSETDHEDPWLKERWRWLVGVGVVEILEGSSADIVVSDNPIYLRHVTRDPRLNASNRHLRLAWYLTVPCLRAATSRHIDQGGITQRSRPSTCSPTVLGPLDVWLSPTTIIIDFYTNLLIVVSPSGYDTRPATHSLHLCGFTLWMLNSVPLSAISTPWS
jgi:hypothetical protein